MKLLLIASILAAVAIAGCVGQAPASSGGQQASSEPPPNATQTQPSSAPMQATVDITSSGFSPSTVTVRVGGTVTWTNQDTANHWPASAVHPAHTAYPEGGGCIGSSFDACRALSRGQTFSFTFDRAGAWSYHDHLNPGTRGTVVVE